MKYGEKNICLLSIYRIKFKQLCNSALLFAKNRTHCYWLWIPFVPSNSRIECYNPHTWSSISLFSHITPPSGAVSRNVCPNKTNWVIFNDQYFVDMGLILNTYWATAEERSKREEYPCSSTTTLSGTFFDFSFACDRSTSLTYISLSTRGSSPWIPDENTAVGIRHNDHVASFIRKWWPTSGGHLVADSGHGVSFLC
jgi:hypothetical protein